MWVLAAVLSWMSVLIGALLISIVRSAQSAGGVPSFKGGEHSRMHFGVGLSFEGTLFLGLLYSPVWLVRYLAHYPWAK
jgi:hypothetical protein